MRRLVIATLLLAAGCGGPSDTPWWLGSTSIAPRPRIHRIELLIGGLGGNGPVSDTIVVDVDTLEVIHTLPDRSQVRHAVTLDQRDRLIELASAAHSEPAFTKDMASDYIEQITITDSAAFVIWNAGPLHGIASAPLEAMLGSLGAK